jgi:RimJ/RimL family protein N-acetyltransferase
MLEIRTLRPDDREILVDAFERLSPFTRYQRFLTPKPALSTSELDYLVKLDHRTRDAVIAIDEDSGHIVGVARYAIHPSAPTTADIAVTVADDWQSRGVGTMLSRVLVRRARDHGIAALTATTLHDNFRSRKLLRRLGFKAQGRDGAFVELALELVPSADRLAA